MTSVLDNAILFGEESTYGTAATLDHAYEGQSDSWKREDETIESIGMRAGRQTRQSARSTRIPMGGSGTLDIDVLNKGFGFLAQGMLGDSSTGPTQVASTTAYTSSHPSDVEGSTKSYTVQVQRYGLGNGLYAYTHKGCVITGWTLSQAVGGHLAASINFDFQSVDTTTPAGTAVYPSGAAAFNWSQAKATINSVDTDVDSIELTADLMMKTDHRVLRNSALKKRPFRNGTPEFTGSLVADFEDNTIYDLYAAGTIVPMVFTWVGEEIESGQNYTVTVTAPACQIVGESPEANLNDLTKQPINFDILWNESDDALTIDIKSTDTAF